MPRFDKLYALIEREVMRLFKNPSALMLIGLLVAFSVLLVLSRNDKKPKMGCWIVYPDSAVTAAPGTNEAANQTADGAADEAVNAAADGTAKGTADGAAGATTKGAAEDSQQSFVRELSDRARQMPTIRVVPFSKVAVYREQRVYPPNTCAIELLELPSADNPSSGLKVTYRHPGGKSEVLEPYLRWFWPVAVDHFGHVAVSEQAPTASRRTSAADLVMEKLQSGSLSDLMNEDLAAAILLLIIQFVTCCQLIVSFTSQDRERGTLTALALTPITMSELLQAKILFHLGLSAIGSAAVIAVLKPAALAHPSLWATLLLTGLGLSSVGMVMASLTKTQSTASLLALCYMLVGAVIFYLATKFSAFAAVKSLSFEHYSFGMVYLSLQKSIPLSQAVDLRPMLLIVVVWLATATALFRNRGWR